MAMILIGIGGNLPGLDGATPLETCTAVVPVLRDLPGLDFIALSQWYRSTPLPYAPQPDYCNGVIRLEGEIPPEVLLLRLHAIEEDFGRLRSLPNAPRVLDLDIIDLNGLIRTDPPPVLPHPRAHLRAFVLRPLLDVAPGWRHPGLNMSVSSLLAELPQQNIQPWDAPVP